MADFLTRLDGWIAKEGQKELERTDEYAAEDGFDRRRRSMNAKHLNLYLEEFFQSKLKKSKKKVKKSARIKDDEEEEKLP